MQNNLNYMVKLNFMGCFGTLEGLTVLIFVELKCFCFLQRGLKGMIIVTRTWICY